MRAILFLCLALLSSVCIEAQDFQIIQDGPVHESYIAQESGNLFVAAAPNQPPGPITELIPSRSDEQSLWIPGYWAWSSKYGQFLWVSGIWRRPPPDHKWISGYWTHYGESWIWIGGFWSSKDKKEISYIPEAPPDPIDQNIPSAPSNVNHYIWLPGYWEYNATAKKFDWLSGYWEVIFPHWVYFPPHYIWREEGYVFIPAYWDWPIDERGSPFSSIYIEPKVRNVIEYEPSSAIPKFSVLETLFPYWPNYSSLFAYEYYFHQEAWTAWGVIPPWWDWPQWWSFTWYDTWWLWWWWTHRGYPNPPWIDETAAKNLLLPTPALIKLMQPVQPPVNVTSNGVVGDQKILQALERVTGKKNPILPVDPKQILQIQEAANPSVSSPTHLEPSGMQKKTQPLPKPFFGPSETQIGPTQKMSAPPIPPVIPNVLQISNELTQFNTEIEMPQTMGPPDLPPQRQPVPDFPTPPAGRTPLPTLTPRAKHPTHYRTEVPERAIPQPQHMQHVYPANPEEMRPFDNTLEPGYPLHYDVEPEEFPYVLPHQGYTPPDTRHQRSPMQTEHHDLFMSHPMPQVNPRGPKAHQVPGDYSTMPEQ